MRMADVPKTRLPAPVEEAERLRDFVRAAELMNGRIAGARVARTGDAAALAGLLAHESIGPRIYTMPNPINAETMTAFIADHLEQRERGKASCLRHSLPRGRRRPISMSSYGRNGRSRSSAAR
jgi:hypothetical protein